MCVPYVSPSEFWRLDWEEGGMLLQGISRYYDPLLIYLRQNAYICAQCHSKTRLKVTDFGTLNCDKVNNKETAEENLSRDEVMRRAEKFKKTIVDVSGIS